MPNVILPNMASPVVGLNQAANWGGSSMNAPTVVPLLAKQVFQGRGRGAQSLVDPSQGPKLSGVRGTIDLLLLSGAAGTARTVCFLTDNIVSPTNFIAIKIDTTNRVRAVFTDNAGTTIGAVTPATAAIPADQTVAVRFAWDSSAPVQTSDTRRASLRVERELVAPSTWATNPAAVWTPFQPTHIMLGGSLGDADYNGTILSCQLSNFVLV